MKHGWILALIPCFLQGAEPGPEALFVGPKPFPSNHYGIIQEYSPFVKSLESAKEMEKSPDLVVVGYGRMKGEDQVIVQQKENSEKREKIGSRYGSKEFPYRLLSVTNTSDRKTFVAVLEDRNKKKHQIRYASETSPPPPAVPAGGTGLVQATPPPIAPIAQPTAASPVGLAGSPVPNPLQGLTPESIQNQIQALEARINDPANPENARQSQMKLLEVRKKQLQSLQSPQDVPAPEITPEGTP